MGYARWVSGTAGALTVIGVIGLAATAYADKPTDARFLDQLDQAGIEYADPQDAVAAARAVCDYLQEGHPVNSAARALKISDHHLSLTKAAEFVVIAEAAYCPGQLSHGNDGV